MMAEDLASNQRNSVCSCRALQPSLAASLQHPVMVARTMLLKLAARWQSCTCITSRSELQGAGLEGPQTGTAKAHSAGYTIEADRVCFQSMSGGKLLIACTEQAILPGWAVLLLSALPGPGHDIESAGLIFRVILPDARVFMHE